jgi:hypothetical protein
MMMIATEQSYANVHVVHGKVIVVVVFIGDCWKFKIEQKSAPLDAP